MMGASAFAPVKGSLPVLQYCTPAQLAVDPAYQRDLDGASRRLIAQIARRWDWSLCQPLVVAQRADRTLFVVDGQHRLEAARLRGDVAQLPCVIFHPNDRTDEAGAFVELNQQRRPLTAFALYNGAVTACEPAATALAGIMRRAGLSFSGAADPKNLTAGQLNNVGTVRKWHARHGDRRTTTVLSIIARSFEGQVLAIGGSIFMGVAACVLEHDQRLDEDLLASVLDRPQTEWLADFRRCAADRGVGIQAAAIAVIREAYAEAALETAA